MINIGDYCILEIIKEVDFGVYLDGGPFGEILLPTRYIPEDAKVGDEIEIFLYMVLGFFSKTLRGEFAHD